MPVAKISNNLKRVKQFIRPDGQIQEGSAEDYYMGHNMAGLRQADRVSEKSKVEEKKS